MLFHDPVTRLPNRQQFAIDYRDAAGMRLVMLTLTGPNEYNLLLRAIGHDYADAFVRNAAQRLQAELGPQRTAYHIALMSFAFTCSEAESDVLLSALNAAFDQPVMCAGIPTMADIALGLADCRGGDAARVLRAALTATQDCRAQGLPWAFYNPQSDKAHRRGFLVLSALSTALTERGQLTLDFQPKYDLATGRLTSAEALLRWRHPSLGQISPAEFIPLSESTSHIHALTDWVMGEALIQAAAWRDAGAHIRLGINVSPRTLARPGFARRTIERLAEHGLTGEAIELEFTEGSLVVIDPIVLSELKQLRDAGIQIALDDFGTGFANFSYITKLPADIIKIDKSFIMQIAEDERTAAVVQAIVALAHRLGYGVVAEGIETERAYDMLAGWDCDEGQGFLMSRPLNAEQFSAMLARPPVWRGHEINPDDRSKTAAHDETHAPPHQSAP